MLDKVSQRGQQEEEEEEDGSQRRQPDRVWTTQGRSGHCREPVGKASRWDAAPFAAIFNLKGDARATGRDFSGAPHLEGSNHGKLIFGVEFLSVGRSDWRHALEQLARNCPIFILKSCTYTLLKNYFVSTAWLGSMTIQ